MVTNKQHKLAEWLIQTGYYFLPPATAISSKSAAPIAKGSESKQMDSVNCIGNGLRPTNLTVKYGRVVGNLQLRSCYTSSYNQYCPDASLDNLELYIDR